MEAPICGLDNSTWSSGHQACVACFQIAICGSGLRMQRYDIPAPAARDVDHGGAWDLADLLHTLEAISAWKPALTSGASRR